MVDVKVVETRGGVYIYFPVDYIRQKFNNAAPEIITLLCGGRVVQARYTMTTSNSVRYRVYNRYVPVLREHDDCYLVVEQNV